jgi:succinyl-CoA:acetate CoA-transferase
LQDSTFDLLDAGKLKFASGCSITLSSACGERVFKNLGQYAERLVLRPQEISNHPEVIRRLGIIAINTALEFDLYGNVNSTHVGGTHMMNGIGGSGDFARNAHLSIFVTKSIAKDGKISRVAPMVSHVDHTEHDIDILVTEQGLADLRGLRLGSEPESSSITVCTRTTRRHSTITSPPLAAWAGILLTISTRR